MGKLRNRLLLLVAICIFCAVATFQILSSHSLTAAQGSVPALLLLFTLLAPILLGAALFGPSLEWIGAAKIHAAFYAGLIVVISAYSPEGHSSPFSGTGHAFRDLFIWILVFELIVITIAVRRLPGQERRSQSAPWLFSSLTIALIGGWGAGVLGWSETNPARVIAAAENLSGDVPYCLNVVGNPVSAKRELTGLSMVAPEDNGGWTWDFHAILVLADKTGRSYFNWSHRTGRFDKITENGRRFHLDEKARCQPKPHFARDLT